MLFTNRWHKMSDAADGKTFEVNSNLFKILAFSTFFQYNVIQFHRENKLDLIIAPWGPPVHKPYLN